MEKPRDSKIETDILRILPHRYPFLLIDRIVKIDPIPTTKSWTGRKATVIKNVTFNEPFFQGHFPKKPIMPGVLIIEAMGQAASTVAYRPAHEGGAMEILFVGVDNVRFRRPVVPGDQLRFEVELIKDRNPILAFHAQAYVDNQLVAEADLLAKASPEQE
jgi:3-hydroxyacyl-[acyl-carrier-protein] dehydratase